MIRRTAAAFHSREILAAVFCVVLGWTAPALAQEPTEAGATGEVVQLVGSVTDRRTGDPIPAAQVELFPFPVEGSEPVWSGRSDARGRFQTGSIPLGAYQLDVEMLPFSPLAHSIVFSEAGIVDLRVEMVRVDYEIEAVVVSARRQTVLERSGFFERQERGIGHFVTRDDIEASAALRVSDLFRRIPGARVVRGSRGGIDSARVLLRGGCAPTVVIDGMMLSGQVVIDDLVATTQVEAVEVYHGSSVPIRYAGRSSCGVVMVWTRDPVTTEGRPLTWRRILVAAGIGLLAFFGTR